MGEVLIRALGLTQSFIISRERIGNFYFIPVNGASQRLWKAGLAGSGAVVGRARRGMTGGPPELGFCRAGLPAGTPRVPTLQSPEHGQRGY